ncbi:MAG: M20/M25/M40 family metallo-hydrolase [Bacteroidales bacterium]|nr:M20/M25/M40 family metallo-hydrolase [Bacteroidales bacterium]
MKKFSLVFSLCAMVFCAGVASAQVAESPEWAARIKAEGLGHSQVEELSQYMTDFLGSRLTASAQKRRADDLMVAKLRELGLSNPRSAFATEFTRGGWDVVKTYAAMTAPYYCAFSVNPRAWSGSTPGLVKGECIVFDVQSKEDLEKYRGKVAGKILLIPSAASTAIRFDPLATRYTDAQLEALTQDNRADVTPRNAAMGRATYDYQALMELRQLMSDFYKTEKPLCIVNGSGTFNVPSGSGVSYRAGDPEPVPEIAMPLEDHGRMVRLIGRGEKVEMELELINKFSDDREVHNIYAEIPGTDPKLKDEIVLIGAHFDSWHGGTGAADNASGCIVMVEAMRILKEIGFKPKRTIRLALWGGEEQGLYGSRGYLENYLYKEGKKLPGFDKFALYLNMDNGSGRFRGIYLERNDAAFPFFEAWKESIESIGFQYLSPRTTGSTDHVTFNRLGLPAYQFIQDALEYNRTYHTIMDTYERLSLPDLRVDATIVAWLVACAANDPGKIPVNPAVSLPQR